MLESSCKIELFITNVDYKRKDPVFWIEVNTDLPQYKHKHKRIPRYYSELKRLHYYLEATLDDVLLPTLPDCPVPRFNNVGQLVSKHWWFTIRLPFEEQLQQHSQQEQPSVLTEGHTENNYERLQIWLNRVSQHERVKQSKILKEFVESEIGFKPSAKQYQLLKYKSSASNTAIAAATPSPSSFLLVSKDDMEPCFIRDDQLLNDSHQFMSLVSTNLNKLLQRRQTFVDQWINLSASYVSYGGLERNPDLFMVYKKLAKGLQQYHDLEKTQISATRETLGEELEYETKNCEATQNAMHRRLKALSDYISSRKHTESSLRNLERLKSSIHIDRDKASEAIAILEESRSIEDYHLQRFQRVDTHLKSDIEQFYKHSVTNDIIHYGLKEYAKGQLFLEKKKLLLLEEVYSVLPNKTDNEDDVF